MTGIDFLRVSIGEDYFRTEWAKQNKPGDFSCNADVRMLDHLYTRAYFCDVTLTTNTVKKYRHEIGLQARHYRRKELTQAQVKELTAPVEPYHHKGERFLGAIRSLCIEKMPPNHHLEYAGDSKQILRKSGWIVSEIDNGLAVYVIGGWNEPRWVLRAVPDELK
jgi:hypothetical protein